MNGLKLVRKKCKMTIQEVANKLEVSKQTVSAWEKGSKVIPEARKWQLSQLFGISGADLGEISRDRAIHLGLIDSTDGPITAEYYNKQEFQENQKDRLLAYTSSLKMAPLFEQITQEKERQKYIERSMHSHFSCNEALPIENQISFIHRANDLYGQFDKVVDLLYNVDPIKQEVIHLKLLDFLNEMETSLKLNDSKRSI